MSATGTLTERLRARPPTVHAGKEYLGLAWPAIEWLEHNVREDMTTLETGSGASTVVFAAAGATHTAVSPDPGEHEAIRAWCAAEGISREKVTFIPASSHTALQEKWQPQPLDLVLIDGAHSFPFPVLDWFFTAPHLKPGARVLVDDAYQPAVNVLARYLRRSDHWELEEVLGHRTPAFRLVGDEALAFDWDDHALGHASFDYLPPGRRAVARLRYSAFERGPLKPLVPALGKLLGRGG
ncbi:MAG TPA: class I SAM-dependent methyltransferase [Thermoleophilaceae bacterium]